MNDTQILKIIKNNIIFIVAFSTLLLLYIIYLCYQIYKDSQKVKKKYATKCPDYWNIGEEDGECNAPTFVENPYIGYPCNTPGTKCVSFATLNKLNKSEKQKKLCSWLANKKNKNNDNISWDSLQCGITVN